MSCTLHTRTYAHTSTHYDSCPWATPCIKAKGLPCARTELISNLTPSFHTHRSQLKGKVRGSEQESCGGSLAPGGVGEWQWHCGTVCKPSLGYQQLYSLGFYNVDSNEEASDTDRTNLQRDTETHRHIGTETKREIYTKPYNTAPQYVRACVCE